MSDYVWLRAQSLLASFPNGSASPVQTCWAAAWGQGKQKLASLGVGLTMRFCVLQLRAQLCWATRLLLYAFYILVCRCVVVFVVAFVCWGSSSRVPFGMSLDNPSAGIPHAWK